MPNDTNNDSGAKSDWMEEADAKIDEIIANDQFNNSDTARRKQDTPFADEKVSTNNISMNDAINFVAKILKIQPEDLQARELENGAGYYVYQESRGGGAIMVAPDKSILFANTSVSYDEQLEAFLAGRRTDVSEFDH